MAEGGSTQEAKGKRGGLVVPLEDIVVPFLIMMVLGLLAWLLSTLWLRDGGPVEVRMFHTKEGWMCKAEDMHGHESIDALCGRLGGKSARLLIEDKATEPVMDDVRARFTRGDVRVEVVQTAYGIVPGGLRDGDAAINREAIEAILRNR